MTIINRFCLVSQAEPGTNLQCPAAAAKKKKLLSCKKLSCQKELSKQKRCHRFGP